MKNNWSSYIYTKDVNNKSKPDRDFVQEIMMRKNAKSKPMAGCAFQDLGLMRTFYPTY